jgi:hypothetical protein
MDELDLEGFSLGEEPVENFLRFNSICGGKEGKKVSHIIWFAVVWCIWVEQNNILFIGKIINVSEVVDNIKRLS